MTTALVILGLVAIAVVVFLRKDKKEAVKVVTSKLHIQDSLEPLTEAGLWAANYYFGRSEVTTIGFTGSMRPFLSGGEVIVLEHNFDGIELGSVVAYRTVGGSSPAVGSRLIHRVVEKNALGWLPKGDTTGMPLEDWNPISRENYIGTLVAVFRLKMS